MQKKRAFSDKSGYGYKHTPSRLFSILHRRYTDCRNPQKRFWGVGRFSGENCRQDTRTAATMYWALHTVLAYLGKTKNKNRRFPPHNSLYNCFRTLPTKNRPDARTKTAQKRRKKCFTHTPRLGENTQDFLQISATCTFLKKVLTSATF